MAEYETGNGTLATRSPFRTASATASVTSSHTGRSVGVSWSEFSRSQQPTTSRQSCSRRRLARVAFASSRPRWNLCWAYPDAVRFHPMLRTNAPEATRQRVFLLAILATPI